MADIHYYTQEGLEKLKQELRDLKTRGRAEIAQQIAEARDKGDLSENAEYDAAKEAQGHLEYRIAQLEAVIAKARVLDKNKIDSSRVQVLSTVRIRNVSTGKEFTYQIVSENEADLKKGKISVTSPIGKGLLGKKIGETADIKVPNGSIQFEILEITV